MLESKIDAIRTAFAPLVGSRIVRYETAELLHVSGEWSAWPDLPIRIYTDKAGMISVSWSRFEDLWLSGDKSLPFPVVDVGEDTDEDELVRWIENGIPEINACLSRTIVGVSLGRGEMSIEGKEIEIWTRLLMDLDNRWLEIFNALDENGYEFHVNPPVGNLVKCL